MYVQRDLEKKVNKYIKDKEIIAIVGARQCGKTTLMKEIFKDLKNAKFITFEDRDILDLFTNHIKEFIEKYVDKMKYLFIDEFQYAKQGGKQLKFIYDNVEYEMFQFLPPYAVIGKKYIKNYFKKLLNNKIKKCLIKMDKAPIIHMMSLKKMLKLLIHS